MTDQSNLRLAPTLDFASSRGNGAADAVATIRHPADPIARTPPTALLDLGRLAMLREVAHRGSFAATAEALCYTPSAVSQQMAALGREMEVVLFERTSHGMVLTASASALVAHCEAVFARLGEAQAELDEIAGGVRGRLRVGSFPTATVAFTARALCSFRGRHPKVELQFADGEPHESVARLRQRELDLAVLSDFDHCTTGTDGHGRPICDDGDIQCTALFDDPFRLVLPVGHPLADAQVVAVSQLAGECVLGGPAGCSPWWTDLQETCRSLNVEPEFETCYQTSDFGALQAVVATGRGLTLVPDLALTAAHPGTVTRPLAGGPMRHVRIATLAGVEPSAACQSMTAVLLELTAARRHVVTTIAATDDVA